MDMALRCAFTGHRAQKLPWGFDELDPRCLDLKQRIYDTAEAVYTAGFDSFLCGMAEGCDLYFCEAVLSLRSEHPEICIEAAIPFAGQADRWPAKERDRYARLLSQCDAVTVLQEAYSPGCMMKRNRYMVDHTELIIACYDGQTGGTLNTLRYALERGVRIVHLSIE